MQRREDEVPRERGLDSNGGCLAVAYLADHDHVRVLAHDGAEPLGEGVLLRLYLRLHDARQMIFDGVFNRDYLDIGRVYLAEERIERGGLAAAGRAGGEQHAVGPANLGL